MLISPEGPGKSIGFALDKRLSKRRGCSRPQTVVVVGDVTEDLWLQISKPAGVVVYDHEVAKMLSGRRRAMEGRRRSHLWLALVTGFAARVYSTAKIDRSCARSWTDEVRAGSSRSMWSGCESL